MEIPTKQITEFSNISYGERNEIFLSLPAAFFASFFLKTLSDVSGRGNKNIISIGLLFMVFTTHIYRIITKETLEGKTTTALLINSVYQLVLLTLASQ
jgi:hypothetical protein